MAFLLVPLVQGLGFSTAGITAGSIAAKLMATAAVANGGGVASVAASGFVAACQSIGALGAVTVATGKIVGVAAAVASYFVLL